MAGLRCEVVRAELDDLLDERLHGARAGRLSAHLAGCAQCGAEWQVRRDLRRSLRDLPPEPLPDGFELRLHRRLAVAEAALPATRPRVWGRLVTPAATGVLGFLAAAALAAPLLTAPAAPSAAGGGPCCVAGAVFQTQLHPPSAAPDLAPDRAVSRTSGSATSGSAMSAFAAAPARTTATTAANTAVTGIGTVSRASGSPAVALTLVAASPPQAVERLTAAAAQAGGSVSALPSGPAISPGTAAPNVATMDAVVPVAAAGAFVDTAARFGTVLARAGEVPAAASAGETVRVLVTVLASAAPPSSATPAGSGAAGRQPAVHSRPTRLDAVLERTGRAAPWAGGALLICLGAWSSLARLRRAPLP